MLYLDYLSHSTGLIIQPGFAIDKIYFRFREHLIRFGFMTYILAALSHVTALMIIDPQFLGLSVSQYVIRVIWFGTIWILVNLVHLAIIHLILNLTGKKTEISSLTGLYLGAEFPMFLMLPLALIFRAIPGLSEGLFYFINILCIIFIIILKIKSIIRTTEINRTNAIILYFMPLIVLISLAGLSVIALFSSIS